MNNPVATYRLQFHKEFTFTDFERIIPYLYELGVSTVYASPIFEAVPGSTHGYDSVNPQRINPEIGTEAQLRAISKRLKELGIQWIQDIVPNHMAFHPKNTWLMDVLEKGQLSLYASFFDIGWNSPIHQGRLMVPFLGASLEEVINKGELKVDYQDQRLVLAYYDSAYPVHLRSYGTVLQAGKDKSVRELQELLNQLPELTQIEEVDVYALRSAEFQTQLATLVEKAAVRAYLGACLTAVNDDPALLKQIADEQAYRLCHHAETDTQINYRRFFTVNGLICLNVQDQAVFEHVHERVKLFLEEGVFQGVRVDHIDGLYDPTRYLEQLRELAGEDAYIVVEKILETGEELPANWPIQGETGYAYLSLVNNVFTRTRSSANFTKFYHKLLGEKVKINEELHDKKAYILNEHMQGERENLTQLFLDLDLVDKEKLATVPADTLRAGIGEFLIQCPVYRYYGNRLPLVESEAEAVRNIIRQIRASKSALAPVMDVLEEAILTKPSLNDEAYNSRALRFYQRCMQFTGPLMAKGVEDTLMYTYNRFIGHDEVGDSPEFFGLKADEFHQKMLDRQARWPLSINATSTHDTKRGEDVRSRLNVLTDLTDDWFAEVEEWQELNADLKENEAPDANDEYFIYQTLVGAYPMPDQDEDNFPNRLTEYLEKALREAKRHSSWNAPNEAYEGATKNFALTLLDQKRPFWKRFQAFHQRIADFGIVNSLAQVVLKCTCPGLPDVYQGCEFWDFSMVDPDNRRPINFEQREKALKTLLAGGTENIWSELWENRYDARIKLWLVHILLNERKQQPELFANGHYVPLQVAGRHKQHVLAFARRYQQTWYVVAVPLGLAQLIDPQDGLDALDWHDTRIVLPDYAPDQWEHRLIKASGKVEKGIAVKDIFGDVPLGLLKLEKSPTKRSAGILLPITSLPSPFGIGDFGPEARIFADFLSRSHQTYWQLLPINPVESGQGHSPYSSNSSMAGSPLLLSLEMMVDEGLLDAETVSNHRLQAENKADFKGAKEIKEALFDEAYENFKSHESAAQQHDFEWFCEQEAYWLDDYALYSALKIHHQDAAWFQWEDAFRLREAEALQTFASQHEEAIEKVKWLQFLFSKQWKSLKVYCNSLGIQLFGDLPFYVSYDSVDVWANPDLFSVDKDGKMTGVAGVPPDYFNDDGQLWGMPVFRWDVLKEQGYSWWIQRLRKNMELYDLLRLDHFRAFADYWEVPASEKTAVNGIWKPGPGADFFQAVQQALGELPFVAEDLGDINEAVYELRDEFNMPGMKVVQFAFGEDMPQTVNIPHNHTVNSIAYTGTHDNNTSRGWYQENASKEERKRLDQYVGRPVSADDVHIALGRMTYGSVAKIAILPMQDVLGLDETARLNTPASPSGNWEWRMIPEQLSPASEEQLREWVKIYNR
ncbi:malto-oligosyltrehalose synthase [Spirosoma soli]|uniref:4-alpha-glucanotransferase n=1 Tax=Spirosoma soli TaxID=1770529 RepID=A0ABW5M2P2_9BACT